MSQLGAHSSTREKALALLGAGIKPEIVAVSLGINPSRITQLMAEDEFREAVTELRFENLQKHNERDNEYDRLEDTALAQLRDRMQLISKPMELLKTIQVLNAAKRRGQSAPEAIIAQQTIVQINLPTKIINKFTTNINNQVIKAGEQELLTIQSSGVEKLVTSARVKELENVQFAESAGDSRITENSGTAVETANG